jgi:hypothetical protein
LWDFTPQGAGAAAGFYLTPKSRPSTKVMEAFETGGTWYILLQNRTGKSEQIWYFSRL